MSKSCWSPRRWPRLRTPTGPQLATGPLREPPLIDAAAIHRRLAGQYELQGLWPLALAAREAAAARYAGHGDRASAATERLAIAAHLRSAASSRGALDVLDVVLPTYPGANGRT